MKTFILAALLSFNVFAQTEPKSAIYQYNYTRVIDGDTIVVSAPFLPEPLKSELSLRIWGIDTPEHEPLAKCKEEAMMANTAHYFTKTTLANAKDVKVYIMSWDKYGGRVLGNITVDGKQLRELLVENQLARKYYGGKKSNWCN